MFDGNHCFKMFITYGSLNLSYMGGLTSCFTSAESPFKVKVLAYDEGAASP